MTSPPLLRRTPGHTLHLVQRGYRRAACFFCERDRIAYLDGLERHAGTSGCAVHAYALMGNHVHLLLTPSRADAVSRLLHGLGRHHERHVSALHDRAGPLWDERVELRPVYPRRYLLACMRYIELNPVRAGLVARPDEYRWSSFGANALGFADALLTPHPFYYALGRTPAERQAAYRALFLGGVLREPVATYQFEPDPACCAPY
jgi:putative transposase